MNYDLLDESYPMVKSILHFEQIHQTGLTGLDKRSDRFPLLCQFWSSTYTPLFFGDASMVKNKPLDQNCLRTMINMHRPYFVLRAINSIGRILLFLQSDDETTYLGLHTCFMVVDLAVTTSVCCSIDSFLRIRCSLIFWVWDKLEGHHLGCRYWLSCFISFSPSWLHVGLLLTRLSLTTISLWEAP